MKTCDDFHDSIVLFDDLGESDRREVTAHVKKCASCRKELQEYRAIMTAIREAADPGHIDEQKLTRYAVHLSEPAEPDYDGKKLPPGEISHIEKHVEGCSPCRKTIERIKHEYQEIDVYLEEAGVPSLELSRASAFTQIKSWAVRLFELPTTIAKMLTSIPAPRLYPAAAMVVASVLVVVWVSPLFRGNDHVYYDLASIEDEDITFVTRSGTSTPSMTEGLLAFSEGRYPQAIEGLEAFISENSNDPNIAYAHYVSGIACLRSAKSDFLGRFVEYDGERLDRGIAHLRTTIDLSDSPRIEEDAYWFLGCAYLMKQEAGPAMEAFTQVRDMEGRRLRQAQQMVDDLATIDETTR